MGPGRARAIATYEEMFLIRLLLKSCPQGLGDYSCGLGQVFVLRPGTPLGWQVDDVLLLKLASIVMDGSGTQRCQKVNPEQTPYLGDLAAQCQHRTPAPVPPHLVGNLEQIPASDTYVTCHSIERRPGPATVLLYSQMLSVWLESMQQTHGFRDRRALAAETPQRSRSLYARVQGSHKLLSISISEDPSIAIS